MIALEAQPGRLSKGIYEKNKAGSPGPFTLVNYQYRVEEPHVPQAVWFNSFGERLGSGDLSVRDLKRIRESIAIGDVFAVLNTASGFTSLNALEEKSKLAIDQPGPQYISDNFEVMITKYEVLGEGKNTKPRIVSKIFVAQGSEIAGWKAADFEVEVLSKKDAQVMLSCGRKV